MQMLSRNPIPSLRRGRQELRIVDFGSDADLQSETHLVGE